MNKYFILFLTIILCFNYIDAVDSLAEEARVYKWEMNLYNVSNKLCPAHDELEENRKELTAYLIRNGIKPEEIKVRIWNLKEKKDEFLPNQPTKECFKFTNSLMIETDNISALKKISKTIRKLVKAHVIMDDNQYRVGLKSLKPNS